MVTYGESQSPRARARVPEPDTSARPAPDAYHRGPSAGSAAVGSRASVGSAAVGGRAAARAAVTGSASPGSPLPGPLTGEVVRPAPKLRLRRDPVSRSALRALKWTVFLTAGSYVAVALLLFLARSLKYAHGGPAAQDVRSQMYDIVTDQLQAINFALAVLGAAVGVISLGVALVHIKGAGQD
jgi:hypothetical protein